jgi:hypothetical protein
VVEWIYSATILNLGTKWRSAICFTPLSLYPKETGSGTAEWNTEPVSTLWRRENLLLLPGIELHLLGRASRILVEMQTILFIAVNDE